ncbi:MAG: SurA N-terminal domain-containing protein [Motiliproteus sp.]
MLQSMREGSQGIIAKIIVGFIIVTFALWGVDSLMGLATDPGAPVTVNGVEISEAEIQNGVEMQRRQLLARMGENADPSLLEDNLLRGMVIEGLIEQSLLLQSAEQKGLSVSQQTLDQVILQTREFQVEGQFDRDQFNAMMRNAGLTPLMYRELLRKEMLMGQEQSAIAATAFALPSEAQTVSAIDRQTRDARFQVLPLALVEANVAVSDSEVSEHYQANQAGYMSQEQVSLYYIELNRSDLIDDVVIDEAELQTQFDQLVAGFEGQEARDAAHILIALSSERSADEAKSLADQVATELNQGAEFAALAEKYSDDSGSAASGGELGLVEKGVMVPAFEDSLFALQAGQVSTPVETEFGFHLIKLNRIDQGEPPAFEVVRAELEAEQREQKSEARFVELSEQLADISFSSGDLQEPSQVLSLPVSSTGLFGREGGEDPLSAEPRVLKAAFAEDVLSNGHNSELIELDRDRVVVIRLKQYQPARTQALDEVRPAIVAQLKQQKAQVDLRQQADTLLAAAQMQTANEAIVEPWQQQLAIARSDTSLDSQLVTELFKMARPAADQLSWQVIGLSDGNVAVVGLSAVNVGAPIDGQQLQALSGFLASRKGQSDYYDMLRNMKAGAEVERR